MIDFQASLFKKNMKQNQISICLKFMLAETDYCEIQHFLCISTAGDQVGLLQRDLHQQITLYNHK